MTELAGDVRAGAGRDAAGGALLSVAELQQAMRTVLAGRAVVLAAAPVPGPPVDALAAAGSWVAVLGSAAGAGCSTLALLLADALASAGRGVHLVDPAPASRSGLAGVTTAELGAGPDGVWRRGARGRITVDRRAAADAAKVSWPSPPASLASAGFVTIVDAGAWSGRTAIRPTGGRDLGSPLVVLVARATVPGLRKAEQVLGELDPVCLVVVGPRRLPARVRAGRGPQLARLDEDGRVVAVPADRRLEVTGLSTAPLPRSLTSRGAALLDLLERGGLKPSDAGTPVADKETNR